MHEKLRILKEKGELTPYMHDVALKRLSVLPVHMHEGIVKDASFMSKIGVSSGDDHKAMLYILMHTKKIAQDVSTQPIDAQQLSKLSSIIFAKRDYYSIDTIFNFYRAVANGLKELEIPIKKMAYPVAPTGAHTQRPYNVSKWMQSMREMYSYVHQGIPTKNAFEEATKDWDAMEKLNFEHWMHFYQEGTHEKYKTAQKEDRYLQVDGRPAIPLEHLRSKMPNRMPNMDHFKIDDDNAKIRAEEERLERESLKKKIRSIDSRLRSALKLVADPVVQRELDKSLDISISDWVRQLQELQRYILLTPLKSATIDDVIFKRANQLVSMGAPKAGKLLIRLAQEEPEEPKEPEEEPEEEKEEDKATPPPAGELEEEMPPPVPEMDMPPAEEPADDEAMDEVARRMNFKEEDEDDASDVSDIDDESDLVVHAQAVPPEEPPADIVVEDEPPAPIPEAAPAPAPAGPAAPADISDILGDVSIEAVVARLETVSNILKNREIPRQLSMIDLELDKLGLASYFPTLAEALRSALESNQYMSSRIEDILSKLRGSMEPEVQIDLTTTEQDTEETDSTLEEVRESLEKNERREKERKERRQKAREAEEMAAAQPPGPPAEELAAPVEVEKAPPRRVAP